MVKDKRGRTIRLILGLVLLLVGGAIVAGLTLSSSGSPRTAHAPPNPGPNGPLGVAGHWKLVFDDEFNGNSLNVDRWNPHDHWVDQNAVTDHLANVTVSDGHAILTLASRDSGAEIGTATFGLKVGEFAQARINFAGSGSTVYNWPAFWTSGPNWPSGGENDIAEGFGALTVNYHSPTVTHMSGRIPGAYAGAFHVYGIYRGRGYARVYWDGRVVGAYKTFDDGQPQTLLLTLGAGNQVVTGPRGAMIVDYVRVWAPATAQRHPTGA
jgi:hypothetical protein